MLTYSRLVEPTTNTYSLRLAHGVRLLSLLFLKRTFAPRHFLLFLPLDE